MDKIKNIDFTLRDRTLAVLKDFSCHIDNIKFEKAIVIEVAYELSTSRLSDTSLLRSIVKIFAPLRNIKFDQALQSDVVFSSYVNRKDYDELVLAAKAGVLNSSYIKILDGFRRRFSFPHLFYFSVAKKVFKLKLSFKARVALYSKLIDYISSYNTLKKNIQTKNISLRNIKYVPFNSSFGMENILTQFVNLCQGETYHLCHGLHFAPNYSFFSVDAFTKELITAKYVLSWGQSFVDNDMFNYKHYIVGNPKYPEKNIKLKVNKESAIVLLARKQYDDNNCKLLKVLDDFSKNSGTKFYIKPHPTSDIKRIKALCDKFGFILMLNSTVNDLLKNNSYGFAISYETTSYFEVMYYNTLCFRFSYEENECYGEFDNRFQDADQLKCQLDKYMSMHYDGLNNIIHDVLRYEIGMGINKYGSVLNG